MGGGESGRVGRLEFGGSLAWVLIYYKSAIKGNERVFELTAFDFYSH